MSPFQGVLIRVKPLNVAHYNNNVTYHQRGAGYPCFCGKERLQSLRLEGQQAGYDGKCRSLRKQQADEEMNRGTPFTVRLKVKSSEVPGIVVWFILCQKY